jgi:hypothetical protein
MQRAADRFYAMQPQLAGATAAEGGEPVKGAAAAQSIAWKQLGEEFFLS